MRHVALLTVVVSCLLVACGGEKTSSSREAPNSLDASLSYLPEDVPFALAIDTDLDAEQVRAVDSILDRFPVGGSVEELQARQLEGGDAQIDLEEDVEPVLGNPLVVGVTSIETLAGGDQGDDFVAAIQARDEDRLVALIDKMNAEEQGEAGGATMYEVGDTHFAVEDDIVVFAGSQQLLEDALQRADGDDHLDEMRFREGLVGSPEGAPVRVYANLDALVNLESVIQQLEIE
jgi:hypothetical protein